MKAGQEHEFEKLFGELRAKMRSEEPGCMFYSLMRSRTDPRAYIVQEQYRDAAAFQAHQESAHGKKYFPAIRAILESIHVEYYDVLTA